MQVKLCHCLSTLRYRRQLVHGKLAIHARGNSAAWKFILYSLQGNQRRVAVVLAACAVATLPPSASAAAASLLSRPLLQEAPRRAAAQSSCPRKCCTRRREARCWRTAAAAHRRELPGPERGQRPRGSAEKGEPWPLLCHPHKLQQQPSGPRPAPFPMATASPRLSLPPLGPHLPLTQPGKCCPRHCHWHGSTAGRWQWGALAPADGPGSGGVA
mmetsp:Transcript_25817/g.72289  ORF Transcript_25817/g.72289 Transcript_25817/m.72289 type:complete len:214 (+) Transcript_25817:1064-1705(+)